MQQPHFRGCSQQKFSLKQFKHDVSDFQQTCPIHTELLTEKVDLSVDDCALYSKQQFATKLLNNPANQIESLPIEEIREWKRKNNEAWPLVTKLKTESYKKFKPDLDYTTNLKRNDHNNENQKINNNNNNETGKVNQTDINDETLSPNELVIKVSFFNSKRKLQEFHVLGSQCLSDLKDIFYCIEDNGMSSNDRPSSFFLIENVFYNDLREENQTDMSLDIIRWTFINDKYKELHLGVMSTQEMAKTKIEDLHVKIGRPYLYFHQGHCEHTIAFEDIRRIHPDDPPLRTNFPLQTLQARISRKKCRICGIHTGKFRVYGDQLTAENPCVFCEHCYQLAHYDEEGKLLYDNFKVFPYFHE